MRARGIGRACGMHDGELILVEQRIERREARMQTEKSVEVDRRIGAAALRLRNRDGWAHAVVIGFAKRHDDVQPIGRAALRSEEHTSELQSRNDISYAVFCLKKKK